MANDEAPYWPDPSIENLFAVATNLDIPLSLHLPSVSEELWASYYQQIQDEDLYRAYQFLNILDAAKSDMSHPSTHAIDATIHMSMGQAHYIQQKAFTWQAYADIFEGPQYGNFLVELQKVNPGYLSKEVFTADLIHAVYADHENDELLDNLVHYSSHFTLCSHEYPKTDFSPEPGFYYGTVIDQAMEAPVPVSCALNLTDCYGVDGCPGSFYAVGTQATDANTGIVMQYRIENNQLGWFPMTGQPSDLPPLTAITARELSGTDIALFIAGYRRDLSGQPVNGEIWQFNIRTETWTQFTPPETLCVNDMEFISYTKLDLNYEDLYCVCANGKIARWRTTSNLDGSDPTTVWNVWANTAAAELTGLWIEENGGINGYAVGWKPGQTDKDGCLLLFDQDNDDWIEPFPQISLNIPLNEVWGNKICDDDSDVLVAGDSGLIKYKPLNFPTFMDISSGTTESLHGLFGGTPQSVYICGDNGVVLRFNKDNFPQNPMTVIQSAHSNVNELSGIYGADPKDGERNVWAVGHNGTNGIVQQYQGGRIMFDGFTDYWDTFFTYLY
ncbi:MAG TPA: hypothetical protein PLV45_01895, partial [bacterium]|nr:hypothetical protein [bacterium]